MTEDREKDQLQRMLFMKLTMVNAYMKYVEVVKDPDVHVGSAIVDNAKMVHVFFADLAPGPRTMPPTLKSKLWERALEKSGPERAWAVCACLTLVGSMVDVVRIERVEAWHDLETTRSCVWVKFVNGSSASVSIDDEIAKEIAEDVEFEDRIVKEWMESWAKNVGTIAENAMNAVAFPKPE